MKPVRYAQQQQRRRSIFRCLQMRQMTGTHRAKRRMFVQRLRIQVP